jgi:hypothetical protein
MVLNLRVVRLAPAGTPASRHPTRCLSEAELRTACESATGLPVADLMAQFDSIGQGCDFGFVQRHYGADPLSLLRFSGMDTPSLAAGLFARFAGIGRPENVRVFIETTPFPEFKVYEKRYNLWYRTGKMPGEVMAEALQREQSRRLAFLQEKFLEDLHSGGKIFVLTRGECLTEPEALAVFAALNQDRTNTLLWTVQGDAWLQVLINAYQLR